MKLLVTGASGAIGRAIRRRALSTPGVDLIELVGPHRPASTRVIPIDVADGAALREAIVEASPDSIIHLAGLSGTAAADNLARTRAVNVESVRTIMDAANELGVGRVILSSSSAVYGDRRREPFSEHASLDPRSHYAESKVAAEDLMAVLAEREGSALALRTFNVYGPAFANSLVNKLVAATPESPARLNGLDTFVRDYIHVDDVVSAMFAGLEATLDRPFTVVNVGSGVPTSNRRLVDLMSVRGELHYQVGPELASYSCANITVGAGLLGLRAERVPGMSEPEELHG